MLHIVTINKSDRYLVDVGFGGNTPPFPVPLLSSSDEAAEFTTIHPAKGKLEYRPLINPTTTTTTSSSYADRQNLWIYSHKETEKEDAEWKEMYAFSELEFFPADFEVMNLQVMTAPQSFFVQTVLCVRTVLSSEDLSSSSSSFPSGSGSASREEQDEEKIIGTLILFRDVVKRKIYAKGEKEEILERLETEEQRWAALGRWFGIYLTPEEKRGIRGLGSELKG